MSYVPLVWLIQSFRSNEQGLKCWLLQAADPSREDVRLHLAELKSQVLAGTHLVFSHVIPLEQDMTQHHLWRLANQVSASGVVLQRCLL